MSDLISRQAAIDAAIEATDSWEGVCSIGRQKRIENYINSLPSAQPEPFTVNLNDTLTPEQIERWKMQPLELLPKPEPCEDAVSRKAVLDALRTCYDTETITYDNGDEYIHYGDAVGEVEQLPSVTPKQRTGKWIKTARWRNVYKCDQCGNYLDFSGVNAGRGSTNFCPNCGAKMEGEQDG